MSCLSSWKLHLQNIMFAIFSMDSELMMLRCYNDITEIQEKDTAYLFFLFFFLGGGDFKTTVLVWTSEALSLGEEAIGICLLRLNLNVSICVLGIGAKQYKTHFKNEWTRPQLILEWCSDADLCVWQSQWILSVHLRGLRSSIHYSTYSPCLQSSSREPETLFLFKNNLPSVPSADKSTSKHPIHSICVLQQWGCWPLSSNANGSKAD